MVSEARKSEMRDYQRSRSEARRGIGQVTRTYWVRGEDVAALAEAVRPFTDHARLMEAVNGALEMSKMELFGIVREHNLPYDPEELFFLSRVGEHLALHPERTDRIVHTAHRVMGRYPDADFSGVRKRIDAAVPPLDLGTETPELEV